MRDSSVRRNKIFSVDDEPVSKDAQFWHKCTRQAADDVITCNCCRWDITDFFHEWASTIHILAFVHLHYYIYVYISHVYTDILTRSRLTLTCPSCSSRYTQNRALRPAILSRSPDPPLLLRSKLNLVSSSNYLLLACIGSILTHTHTLPTLAFTLTMTIDLAAHTHTHTHTHAHMHTPKPYSWP